MFNQKTKLPLPPGSQLELRKEAGSLGREGVSERTSGKSRKRKEQEVEGWSAGRRGWMGEWMDGWMDRWMPAMWLDARAASHEDRCSPSLIDAP